MQAICEPHPVASLSIFGSAVTGGFLEHESDIDLLVKMADVPTIEYSNAYFSLLKEFEELFKGPVDLVTEPSLTNPYSRPMSRRQRSLSMAHDKRLAYLDDLIASIALISS